MPPEHEVAGSNPAGRTYQSRADSSTSRGLLNPVRSPTACEPPAADRSRSRQKRSTLPAPESAGPVGASNESSMNKRSPWKSPPSAIVVWPLLLLPGALGLPAPGAASLLGTTSSLGAAPGTASASVAASLPGAASSPTAAPSVDAGASPDAASSSGTGSSPGAGPSLGTGYSLDAGPSPGAASSSGAGSSLGTVTASVAAPPAITSNAPAHAGVTHAFQDAGQSLGSLGVADVLGALPLRELGPAVAGGRISDLAVHPQEPSTWYVAAGSGGVWKTTNAGTTWTPIFDDQPSYSIGALAIDPTNPEVVWVGTGENVSGRHVGWGSGVYRSADGGRTWRNMGLGLSEHIGKILVHPHDGEIVLVAAEGPLWSAGGERGVYKTTDGGESWRRVLRIDTDTGVTDLEFDPGDPNTVYAASYQRRRHIWGFMAGGPGSGIHKSTDGGDSWREVTTGLPPGDMGKIGLATTPADPSLVYATIEATPGEEGFYRSSDRGESWERRNSYISGGTGPHYYQEIEASPIDPDLVIQMDVFLHITRDGGRNFAPLGTGREKHSDNHALWFDPMDANHLLAGSDAGLYETFDMGDSWRHFPNMPISQFYKVAVSSEEPFYAILGGAQDLGTLWGPSRTRNIEGVRNSDWYFPMGADGYGVEFDPLDPDLFYLMTQQGNLYRVHRRDEEAIRIQPQPAPQDPPERWNWDSPLHVSPHSPSRVYFASQRLWRSEDRGNSWTAISPDLTTGTNRYELPFMGRVWELDALHDNGAMSKYATITAISESPVAEGLVYVGTDDGLIQVNGGADPDWRRAAPLPGVPDRSFINDVEAARDDADAVFAIADAHKIGDYTPYVFRSDDRGENWRSIAGDLPPGTIAWAIAQDHEEPELLFLAAEWGLYFSPNGGENWHRLRGAPTIAFRDLDLQRRDGDVVGATFGRGFYVFDDYSPLREIARGALDSDEGGVWPVRDAWWYVPSVPNQAPGRPTLGSTAYSAPNPDFGAVFTYHLPETLATAAGERRELEETLRADGSDVPFPGYDALALERMEEEPFAVLRVTSSSGEAVRLLTGPARAGLHRVSWDLRRPAPNPVGFDRPSFRPPWVSDPIGPLVGPGEYAVQLLTVTREGVDEVGEPQVFLVKPTPELSGSVDLVAIAEFQRETAELQRRVQAAGEELNRYRERLRYMRAALRRTPGADLSISMRLDALNTGLEVLARRLQGDPVRGSLNESSTPSIAARVGSVAGGHWNTRQEPTATQRANLRIAQAGFDDVARELAELVAGPMADVEEALAAAGAPWVPGRIIGRR